MNVPQPEGQAVRRRGLGAFATWPDELLAYFLANAGLSTRELLALACASKLMRLMVCEEPLWLQRHLDCWKRPFEYRGSWRATCLAYTHDCGRPGLTAADLLPPAAVPGFSSDVLYRRWYRCHVDLSTFLPGPAQPPPCCTDGSGSGSCADHARVAVATAAPPGGAVGEVAPSPAIAAIPDASGMSAEEFEARFDVPRQPVLLGGLAAGWPGGLEAWQPPRLAQLCGDQLFKVTKPFVTGGRTKMRLVDYLFYCSQQHDEEPLYIFDSSFAESAPQLAAQFAVPHLFRHDLFACLEYKREDYRWLVVGPARSGASWHVDPSATSAWNTLLFGRKRWALYPPGRVPPGVQVHIDADGHPSFQAPTSLQWYLEVFPQLPPEQRPLEVMQQAGDTIFVPAGWWHCVLNLGLAVAVTQNFVSPANLEAAVQWQALGAGSMFDAYLVPAYLRRRQAEAEEGRQQGGQQRNAPMQEGPPAKRRRQAQPDQRSRQHLQQGEQALVCGLELGQQGEQDEASERRAAAEGHLQELSMGFSKSGLLAPWLRQLLQQLQPGMQDEHAVQQQQQQQLRPQERESLGDRVWQLALQWTELSAWQPRVTAACCAAGLAAPRQRHEWLPLATGTCVVFEVSGAVLKFFHPEDPHSAAMAAMEAAAYCCIQQAASGGSASGARGSSSSRAAGSSSALLLGAGLLEIPVDWSAAGPAAGGVPGAAQGAGVANRRAVEAAEAPLPAPLPFLVVRKAPGVTVGSCSDHLSSQQWQAAAAAVGRSLAAFHQLPLPAAPAAGTADACADGSDCSCEGGGSSSSSSSTAWVARDGIAYSSALGATDLRQEEAESPGQLLQRQRLVLSKLFPQAAALLAGAGAGVGQAQSCAGHRIEGSNQGCGAAASAAAAAAAGDELRGDAAAAPACSCRRCRAWQPFLSFLRRQRRHAAAAHRREEALPPLLLEQVESYLPADPAALLGFGSGCGCSSSCCPVQQGSGCGAPAEQTAPEQTGPAGNVGPASGPGTACGSGCAGSLPAWVHGDLTAENILLSTGPLDGSPEARQLAQQQGWQQAQQQGRREMHALLIDFADGGHGDPLFDFVPLLLRTLRCDQAAGEAFLAYYSSALAGTGPPPTAISAAPAPCPLPACWPRRPPGTSLSYVAMCYTLLHELGPVHDVFKRRPELWEARSLEEVQAAVWGWLDRWFEGA